MAGFRMTCERRRNQARPSGSTRRSSGSGNVRLHRTVNVGLIDKTRPSQRQGGRLPVITRPQGTLHTHTHGRTIQSSQFASHACSWTVGGSLGIIHTDTGRTSKPHTARLQAPSQARNLLAVRRQPSSELRTSLIIIIIELFSPLDFVRNCKGICSSCLRAETVKQFNSIKPLLDDKKFTHSAVK